MLRALADRLGVVSSYVSASSGGRHDASDATRASLVGAMGFDGSSEEAAAGALSALTRASESRLLEPVQVVRDGTRNASLISAQVSGRVEWRLEVRRDGKLAQLLEGSTESHRGRLQIRLPDQRGLDPGYYRLRLSVEGGSGRRSGEQARIVVPHACVRTAELIGSRRYFGYGANLYTIRSRSNWGVGDLTDLRSLLRYAGASGAAFVGINPLHAANEATPFSPYTPSSRLYTSRIYLDLQEIPEFASCKAARMAVRLPEFQRALAELQGADRVDYQRVLALKTPILELLHREFVARHAGHDTERERAYRRFLEREGSLLEDFATFVALGDRLGNGPDGWRLWPARYRDARSPDVARFRQENAHALDFQRFIQFELDRQLERAAAEGRDQGLAIGLYADLALGISGLGFDAWAFSSVFCRGATVGAPPDEFSDQGQDWNLPAIDPHSLRAQGYDYWVRVLRRAFSHSGALRIDHVMGLFRLWWIPPGRPAAEGAYVRYPAHDLLGVLALESQRQQALVVGEDLGTIPPGLGARLERWGVLSSRVLYFERRDSTFRSSGRYSRRALVSANNHDLPPLLGYFSGDDLVLRHRVGQIPDDAALKRAQRRRERDCRGLLRRLNRDGFLDSRSATPSSPTLCAAVTAFLCSTPAPLVSLSLDDLVGETEPVNLPGVSQECHPSWVRRMRVPVDEIPIHPIARAALAAVPPDRTGLESG